MTKYICSNYLIYLFSLQNIFVKLVMLPTYWWIEIVAEQKLLTFQLFQYRSVGALRVPASSWRPFRPLDFVLCAPRALSLCYPRGNDWKVC